MPGGILVLEGIENVLWQTDTQRNRRFYLSLNVLALRVILFVQSAVRAAVHGRVLVLEGIEKTERNVLPVLNNLLENREMQLDDGRFLMSPARYDKLLMVTTTHRVPVYRRL